MSPDLQRIQHIKEYCAAIGKTIERYGNSFEIYAADADYQRSVSFSILQIGELSGGLSAQYRQATANRIQWGPMKAMRNLVAITTEEWIKRLSGKPQRWIFPLCFNSVRSSYPKNDI